MPRATCELGPYAHQLGPYAINWSDEEQKIYILSRKEQRQTRRWWRQLHSFGLRRERGGYDIVADMERVQAAVDAEVAGCVEELVQKVEHACKPCPKVLSPPHVRRTRAGAHK